MRSRSLEERFWAKVDKAGPAHPYDAALGECWLWVGAVWRRGYDVELARVRRKEGWRPA